MQESREVQEIVAALQAGEYIEESFRRLFLMFHPRLVSQYRHWGCDPDVARDLSQDVVIQAFRSIKSFQGKCKLWTWLFTIARHRHLNYLHREKKKREEHERSLEQATSTGSFEAALHAGTSNEVPYDEVRGQERLLRVLEEMDRLPPRMRECLLLRVDQDLSYQEIADALGIAIGTVKSHLYEARELLRERLQDEFDDIDF